MADSNDLQTILNITFSNPQLLQTALTHRSYINEAKLKGSSSDAQPEHNERLEFLGDAVLELVVTDYLYNNYQEPEGILTNWRSALVRAESLSAVAVSLGIEKFIRLSRGEARGSDRARKQILANVMEALIGAIYLDQGYEQACQFITDRIVTQLPEIIKSGSWLDAKTKFQELIQDKEGFTPVYKVLKEVGPDHDKIFTVGVFVGSELRGKGSGSSKQNAQQAAAEHALKKIT